MNRIEEAAGVQAGTLVRLQVELPVTPVSCAAATAAAAAKVTTHAGARAFGKAAGFGLAFIAATAAAYGAGVAGGFSDPRDDLAGGAPGALSAEALLQARADLLAA
ncbi:hypothetical protein [Amycolatopsis sp.]|uniref:hypothetical protein n=1 Tax=Amycolatopsis sp. TaxID=37632 RepID=UPI002D8092E1|nr:hypothetical protein [Amycolatopsis sp.]HET6711222.1 hypothetical protein [Amycolatopsis sp.]